jgi:hypothetical protein
MAVVIVVVIGEGVSDESGGGDTGHGQTGVHRLHGTPVGIIGGGAGCGGDGQRERGPDGMKADFHAKWDAAARKIIQPEIRSRSPPFFFANPAPRFP